MSEVAEIGSRAPSVRSRLDDSEGYVVVLDVDVVNTCGACMRFAAKVSGMSRGYGRVVRFVSDGVEHGEHGEHLSCYVETGQRFAKRFELEELHPKMDFDIEVDDSARWAGKILLHVVPRERSHG